MREHEGRRRGVIGRDAGTSPSCAMGQGARRSEAAMSRNIQFLLLTSTLLSCSLLASTVEASAPTARLSWSRDAVVEDLAAPPGAHTPLYMRISSPPPGFTALATELRWTPNNILGPCYGLFADSALSEPDGWWEWQTPPLALGADSSFYYALHPRESDGDIVIKMMFGGGSACGNTPATICLGMVKFVEASGDTTYAEILGSATVLGGDGDCGVSLQRVAPIVAVEAEATRFDVLGTGFSGTTTASLIGSQDSRSATSVEVLSSGHLRAIFDTRAMLGRVELLVASEGGDSSSTIAEITSASAGPAYQSTTAILWVRPGRLTLPAGQISGSMCVVSAAPSLVSELQAFGVVSVRACAVASVADPAVAAALASSEVLDMFVLELADTNVIATVTALRADTANVRLACPNWLLQYADVVPTDRLMAKSWNLRNTGTFPPNAGALSGADSRASRAWEISTGGNAVKVGVLDSGSRIYHPDLQRRYFNSWSYGGSGDTLDFEDHGVPVAGIIAAVGNGGGDGVGVDWDALVYSYKVGGSVPDVANLAAALDVATAQGMKFVNMSLFAVDPADPVHGAFAVLEPYAYNAFHAGMFLSASSGNVGSDTGGSPENPRYPADIYPYVVSAGASTWTGERWDDDAILWGTWGYTQHPGYPWPNSESAWGNHLRLLAPGGRFVPAIVGDNGYMEPDPTLLYLPHYYNDHTHLDPESPYWGFGGTSAAAPVVTGAAALIRSVAGDSLGAEEIAHLLAMTAYAPQNVAPGYHQQTGWGIVDIEQALWAVRPGLRIERGVAVGGGVVTDTVAGPVVDLIEFPGLPSPLYGCNSSSYTIRRRVDFTEPFLGRPLVLKRTHGSIGAMTIPVQIRGTQSGAVGPSLPRWEPSIDTLAAYPDSCVLTTKVWRLIKNGQSYWWPCAPEEARFAYTLVGMPPGALSVDGATRPSRGLRFEVGPSPTRSGVTVRFVACGESRVRLDLLDVQGRRVRDMGEHSLVSGELRLDLGLLEAGRRLSPGLYFLRATTPSISSTRRVVLIQ